MRKELLALWLALPGHALISPPPLVLRTSAQACRSAVARMYDDDDSWVSNRGLLSAASLDVLFKFGPVVYGARCFDSDEYDESVRKFMRENRGVSRKLAEQNINQFLDNTVGYMAKTTAKGYKGPQETDLMPPVGIVDKLLVVAWVAILTAAVRFISAAAMVAEK